MYSGNKIRHYHVFERRLFDNAERMYLFTINHTSILTLLIYDPVFGVITVTTAC
jgi:hypothetical protein